MGDYDIDVYVGNDIFIDKDVYSLWLDGFSVTEAVDVLKRRGILEETGISSQVLFSDVSNHYMLYSMLEKFIQQPISLKSQLRFQMLPETEVLLIQNYYEFDDIVLREILGKKLSSKTRKELDDVSEKTSKSLKSCRRQFDNTKRVFKAMEDRRGSLISNIQTNFLLSHELAQKYAAVVFLTNNRFETGKKKLCYLNFNDFSHCATTMIAHWSYGSAGNLQEDSDVDLDREFLHDLKEIKILSEKEILEEHKSITCQAVCPLLDQKSYSDLEANFKVLSRALINIACGLVHSKEIKDFFVDLVEKFIDVCKNLRLPHSDITVFLAEYETAVSKINRVNSRIVALWERYMSVVKSCLLQMYHS